MTDGGVGAWGAFVGSDMNELDGSGTPRFASMTSHSTDSSGHHGDGDGEEEDRQTVGAHERGENFAQGCAGASSALPRRGTLLNSSLVASRRFA
jgi:hypothetical protein